MACEIRTLTPETLPDLLYFFEHGAFASHPQWSGCYCHYYFSETPQEAWAIRAPEENRDETVARVREGTMSGYLAYEGGRVVGWCNANPKNRLHRLAREGALVTEATGDIISIVCFLIHPDKRREGVATALLEGVLADASRRHFRLVEAYPAEGVTGDAHHYHGPVSMYEKAGFFALRQAGSMTIMQKWLRWEDNCEQCAKGPIT